jgi:integrase
MSIRTSITRRERKRVLNTGATILHARWVLNFRDPRTGKRRQLFSPTQREAIAKRDSILAAIATSTYQAERSSISSK